MSMWSTIRAFVGSAAIWIVAGGLALLAALIYWQRRRRLTARSKPPADGIHCVNCGYDLSRLEYPRCPECGALRGFTVPLEELGLTEAEVRAGFARRRQPQEDAGAAPQTEREKEG